MTDNVGRVIEKLNEMDINYKFYSHKPVFTMNETKEIDSNIPAAHPKNLFMKSSRGPDRRFLLLVEGRKRVKTRELGRRIESKNPIFADADELKRCLGINPGSVSPFGLINDDDNKVEVLIDRDLLDGRDLAFHPNINDATLVIAKDDFIKFLRNLGKSYKILEIPEY